MSINFSINSYCILLRNTVYIQIRKKNEQYIGDNGSPISATMRLVYTLNKYLS